MKKILQKVEYILVSIAIYILSLIAIFGFQFDWFSRPKKGSITLRVIYIIIGLFFLMVLLSFLYALIF